MDGFENFALAISNSVLEKSFSQDIPVSPLKLQKLLYFIYKRVLQRTRTSLFEEHFEAWQYGPVLPSVYEKFKHYKFDKISDYYYENGNTFVVSANYEEFHEALDFVWSKYSDVEPWELVELTHLPGTAWKVANDQNALYIEEQNILQEDWSFRIQ